MFRAVPYKVEYHKQVIDLLGLLWGNWSFEMRDKVFQWKYLENPYCKEPQFFLMLDGAKVVAVRGFFVNPYLVNKELVYAGVPADSVTHPAYRRQGLFEALTSFAMQNNADQNFPDFYLSLSSNPLATRGHQKEGYKKLGSWNELYRFTAYPIFPSRLKGDISESAHKSGQLEIRISKTLDPIEIAGFFSQEEKNGFHLLKDERFFTWRYKQPAFSYVFLEVKSENQLMAWASFSLISKGRALMTDFYFSNKEAFNSGINYLSRQMGLFSIQTRVFSANKNTLRSLKALGFMEYNNLLNWFGRGPAEPILVKTAVTGGLKLAEEINEEYLSNPQNWDLHLIDADGT